MNGISVIIASRNQAPRLRLALRALTAQTLAPGEIIVVDDASEDGTKELVAEAATWFQGPELQYVRQPVRRGSAAARNAGARIAKHGLLAFLDGDVLATPEHLA